MKLPNKYAVAFREIMKQRAVDFSSLLYDYEALVAGGSVLSALVDSDFSDFDVYVNVSTAEEFFIGLDQFFTRNGIEYMLVQENIPTYDDSFMVKNGILLRHSIAVKIAADRLFNMDIMVVEHPPLKVVNNFDLTIVQSWYDGVDVYTSHPRETLSKVSYLNEEYREAFNDGNYFINKRIEKYVERGFLILVDNRTPPPPNKHIGESWISRMAYRYVIDNEKKKLGQDTEMMYYKPSNQHYVNRFLDNRFKPDNGLRKLHGFIYVGGNFLENKFPDNQLFDILVNIINTVYWKKYLGPLNEYTEHDEQHLSWYAEQEFDIPYVDDENSGFTNAGQIEYYRYISSSFDYLVSYAANIAPPELQIYNISEYISKHEPNLPYKTVTDFENLLGYRYLKKDDKLYSYANHVSAITENSKDDKNRIKVSRYLKKRENMYDMKPIIWQFYPGDMSADTLDTFLSSERDSNYPKLLEKHLEEEKVLEDAGFLSYLKILEKNREEDEEKALEKTGFVTISAPLLDQRPEPGWQLPKLPVTRPGYSFVALEYPGQVHGSLFRPVEKPIPKVEASNEVDIDMNALSFKPTRINPRVPFVHERQRRNLSEVDVQDQLDRDAWRLNTLVDYYVSIGVKPDGNVYGLRPSEVEDLLNNLDPKWQRWVPRGFFL